MTGNSNIKTGLRAVIAFAVLAAAFVLPAQAFAQEGNCANAGNDPTAAQYCSTSGVQTGAGNGSPKVKSTPVSDSAPVSVNTPSGTVAEKSSSGSLPFTGFDVGILLLVAGVLTGTGLALRRLTASGVHKS